MKMLAISKHIYQSLNLYRVVLLSALIGSAFLLMNNAVLDTTREYWEIDDSPSTPSPSFQENGQPASDASSAQQQQKQPRSTNTDQKQQQQQQQQQQEQTSSPQLQDNYFQVWANETNCPYQREDIYWTSNLETFQPPDCDSLMTVEKPSAMNLHLWTPNASHTAETLMPLLEDCPTLRRTFPSRPMSDEEAKFPLAYVFVGQRNPDQTLRLFRMLYWPQNTYCFTYDNKSEPVYKTMMLKLAACFPENVLINPHPINVYWAEDSILRSVMSCMTLLNESPRPWRYVQIVSYNDFPLKTNLEMVRILKMFNGGNDCDLIEPHIHFYYYYRYYRTNKPMKQKQVPPAGMVIFKGSYATTMTREFVDFMLKDALSKKLLEWMNGTWCAEEHYWATLIHNQFLNAPGSFPGQCLYFYKQKGTAKKYVSRCQIWTGTNLDGHQCLGTDMHASCLYGVDDVPWLITRPEMFAHKFYNEFQPASLYCMEQWHWSRTCSRKPAYVDGNLDYYENLPAIRYQRVVDKDEFIC